MRVFLLLISGLYFYAPVFAQQLNGKVILGPLETDPPLGNVRLEVQGMTPVLSEGETGLFTLSLPGVQAGDQIPLNVIKEGYSVINQKALRPLLPRNPLTQTLIHVAPIGERDQMAVRYYQIKIEQQIDADFKAEMKQLLVEGAGELDANRIGQLARERDAALSQAARMAAALAKVDLTQASALYQRAFTFFPEQLDSVLAILNEDLIDAELVKARDIKAQAETAEQNAIESYMLRAKALIMERKFIDAQRNFQKAIDADSTNISNLWDFAYYLSDQNQSLQAQTFFEQALRLVEDSVYEAALLNNLGILYKEQNQYDKALEAHLRSLAIRHTLFEKKPALFAPDLSASFNNLGILYADWDRTTEALDMYQQAMHIRRKLVQEQPSVFGPYLANTLNNLGNLYQSLSQSAEAITVFQEALAIYDSISGKKASSFEADKATTNNNLGIAYQDMRQLEPAISAYEKALIRYRHLATQNPRQYLPPLAATLNNLGTAYRQDWKVFKAIEVYEEALRIRRDLARQNPSRFDPVVASTLKNLALSHQAIRQFAQADSALSEALAIVRDLAEEHPERFEPLLAMTLNDKGNLQYALEQFEAAEKAGFEAMNLQRKLAQQNPLRFEPELASTLENLASTYMELGQFDEAEAAFAEAQLLYRKLARQNPRKFRPDLARMLNNQGMYYKFRLDADPGEHWVKKGLETVKAAQQVMIAYPDSAHFEGESVRKRTAGLLEIFQAPELLASAYVGKGFEWLEQEEVDSAYAYFQTATVLYAEIGPEELDPQQNFYALSAFEFIARMETDFDKRYELQQQAIAYAEPAFAASLDNPGHVNILAGLHGDLAWYGLFVEQFAVSEQAAQRSLDLAPTMTLSNGNLALALLFQGKFDPAREIYLAYADQVWIDERFATFREAFLADLEELEKEGITHPDVGRIKELLEQD